MDTCAKILLVDDDELALSASRRVLESRGYAVSTAGSGEEAFRAAIAEHPDLVLLDRVLPDIDGLQVCRRIKSEPALESCLVVIFSGTKVLPDEQADGLEAGADGYIPKPVSNRELLARVEALLRVQGAERQTRHLNRVLRAIRQIDRLIVGERDRNRLIQGVCTTLIETRGYEHVWIALLGQDGALESVIESGQNKIRKADWEELPACIRQALTQPQVWGRNEQGMCQSCLFDCKGNDTLAIRLEHAGKIWGALCVTVPAHLIADQEEQTLLTEIAQDLSLALHHLELEDQRAQTERAFRHSELKFRGFVEQSCDGIALTDEQGIVVEWNRALEDMTGLPAEQAVGRPIWDVQFELGLEQHKTPERYAQIKAMIGEALHSGRAPWLGKVLTSQYHHPNGSVRYIEGVVFAIESGQGFMLGSVSRDVTDRVQVENRLRERENFLDTLLQTIPVPVFYKDRRGRYLGFNAAFERFFGRNADELVGKTVFDLHPPELAEIYYAKDDELFEQGGIQRYETQVRDARGIFHEVIFEKAALVDRQGQINGLVGAILDITDRKRNAELLRSIVEGTGAVVGEEFFRAVVRHLAEAMKVKYALIGAFMPDGHRVQTLAVWTGDGYGENFVYELAGTPCEQVVQTNECYYPQDVQTLFPHDALLVQMGAASYRGFLLRDKTGTPLGIMAVLNDGPMDEEPYAASVIRIFAARTVAELERAHAEASLQASETWFRSVLESAPDSIIISDGNGRIVSANAQAETMFGYPRNRLIGRPVESLIPPHLAEAHRTHCANYRAQPVTRPMGIGLDLQAVGADGREFPVEVSLSPVNTPDGIQVISVIRDITERKRVENLLRLQSAALEAAANAIVITDHEGRITWVNPAFSELTGYAPAEVVGQTPRLLKSGRQDPAFYQDLWKTILAGKVWQGELINRRRDGTLYTEEMTITPLLDKRGEITHFIAIKQDVTARKEAEAALSWELRINNALADLSKRLLSAMSFEDISSLVLHHAQELTNSPFGFVGYIDPQSGHLISPTLTKGIWETCQVPQKTFVFEQFTGLWGWVLNNRQPLLTNDPSGDPRSSGVPEGHIPIRRFLAAPAMIGEELVGIVALVNAEHEYSSRDLQVVERLAMLYALSIQRQRLEHRQQELTLYLGERVKELSCLYGISSLAGRQELTLDEILAKTVELIPPAMRTTELACARIIAEGREYATANFRETPWKLERHIFAGNEPIGTLQVCYLTPPQDDQDLFIKEEFDLINAIVERLGETAGRKRAETRLRQYAEEQAALYTITSVASAFLDPERLLSAVLDVILPLLGADAAWVIVPGTTADGRPQAVAWRGISREFLEAETGSPLESCSICSTLLKPGSQTPPPMLITQCPRVPAEILAATGLRDHIGIPLRSGDRVLGILNVGWRRPHEYSVVQQTLLDTMGQQIGLALRNAQLYQAARQVDRLRALNAIGSAAVSSLDLHAVLHEILRLTCQALNAQEGSILQRNRDTNELVFITTLNKQNDGILRGYVLPAGQGIVGWTVQHRQSVYTEQAYTDERFYAGIDELTGITTRSLLCTPLIYHDEVIGAIEVINKQRGTFNRDDLSLLEAVASIAVAAMANAQLYQATLTRAEELSTLNEIGLRITARLDQEQIFAETVTQIQRLFQADGVIALHTTGDHGELRIAYALLGENLLTSSISISPNVYQWIVDHPQSLLIQDLQNDTQWNSDRFDFLSPYLGAPPRSMMIVPLTGPERLIGAIQMVGIQPGTFTTDHLRILQAISATISVALENARLYNELKVLLWEREQAQARLIHTEKMSALGRLAASLAHEINNPLQSVIGCLDLSLEELEEDSPVRSYVQVARGEVERVARTMVQMRNLYRRGSTEKEWVELNTVVEQVIELTRKRCQETNVKVVWEAAPYLPMMMVAADEIRQVFLNLLLNALEAMPNGGSLTIRSELTQDPPGVRILFADTGVGIPPEVMQHLFEPFYSTKPEGTGLGLTISNGIVERHGGRIEVESQVGQGSTFTVWLPETD